MLARHAKYNGSRSAGRIVPSLEGPCTPFVSTDPTGTEHGARPREPHRQGRPAPDPRLDRARAGERRMVAVVDVRTLFRRTRPRLRSIPGTGSGMSCRTIPARVSRCLGTRYVESTARSPSGKARDRRIDGLPTATHTPPCGTRGRLERCGEMRVWETARWARWGRSRYGLRLEGRRSSSIRAAIVAESSPARATSIATCAPELVLCCSSGAIRRSEVASLRGRCVLQGAQDNTQRKRRSGALELQGVA